MVNVTSLYIPDKKVVHWRKCGTPQRLTWKNTISRGSRRGAKGLEKVHSAVRNPADPRWLADKCDATGPSWTDFMRKRDLRIQNKGEREKKRERRCFSRLLKTHTQNKEESSFQPERGEYRLWWQLQLQGGRKKTKKSKFLLSRMWVFLKLCAL